MMVSLFKNYFNKEKYKRESMLSDSELIVILKSFYRSTDGVLISVIKRKLGIYGFFRKGIVTDAINEGILKRITPVRVILTKYGRQVYRDAKADGLI